MRSFSKQYAAQGFEILGLADDVDAGKDAIAKVAQKTGVTYPILLTDGKVQKAYGGLDVSADVVLCGQEWRGGRGDGRAWQQGRD